MYKSSKKKKFELNISPGTSLAHSRLQASKVGGAVSTSGQGIKVPLAMFRASPVSQMAKNLPTNAGDPGSIPVLGRYHGEGNGNPLQDFCLENPTDRGAWRATVHRGATTEWLTLSHAMRCSQKTLKSISDFIKKENKNTKLFLVPKLKENSSSLFL